MSATVVDRLAPAAGVNPADWAGCCPGCAAPLAGDERFCVACGLRVAPDELRLAALPLLAAAELVPGRPGGVPALRRPVVRSAAATAVIVLTLGIAIGATIGPAAVGQTSAAERPVILLAGAPAAPAADAGALATSPGDGGLDAGSGGGNAPDQVGSLADTAATSAGAAAPAADSPGVDAPASDAPPAGDAPGGDRRPATPVSAPPGSLSLAGVVVVSAVDGEGFVLAARDGRLLHVHASGCGVAPGDDLHLRARRLANGTWSADRVRRVGTGPDAGVDEARVAGTVAWIDPASGRYALGTRGAMVFIAPPVVPAPATAPAGPPAVDPAAPTAVAPVAPAAPAPATAPAGPPAVDPAAPTAVGPAAPVAPAPAAPAVPAPPPLGARVGVRLALTPAHDAQPAELVEQSRRMLPPAGDLAAPAPLSIELAGTVQTTDAQARTLVLALDGLAQPPVTVTLTVPQQLDLARMLPAQRVAVTAAVQPDGSLALSGVSPDGDAIAADDAVAFQGDQAPTPPPAGDAPTTAVATCTTLAAPAHAAGPPHA